MASIAGFTILSAVAEAERDRTRERIAEVKRDQRQRRRYLGGTATWGDRGGDAGHWFRSPSSRQRWSGCVSCGPFALRAIADTRRAAGVSISQAGVKNAPTAADRARSY